MPPLVPTSDAKPDFAVMRRFLPYLWPKDAAGLRVRIVFALLLVVISKLIQLSMAWVYGRAIDRMVPGMEDSVAIAIALVAAYAGARFGGVLFDNAVPIAYSHDALTEHDERLHHHRRGDHRGQQV